MARGWASRKKEQRKPRLATEDTRTRLREPELHDDALKRVTTQCATAKTKTVKGFYLEPCVDKVPTTTPSRGL
jgi:hypothetical protein